LAILDDHKKIRFLIEAKAVSLGLIEKYARQAQDYGAHAGISWVMLTNSERWMLYRIKFGKPLDKELVAEFNLLDITPKSEKELELLFVLSKEGQEKSVIEDFYTNIQIKNKFIIGCLLNSEEVYSLVRKTMRKLFGDVKISNQEIADIVVKDIIKREITDSDESKKAKKTLTRSASSRVTSKQKAAPPRPQAPIAEAPVPERQTARIETLAITSVV
jgi:hypothetical protein